MSVKAALTKTRSSSAPAEPGRIATVTLNVLDHIIPRDRRQPYRVRCSDSTAAIDLVFFHGHADYLQKTLPPGSTRVVSGRIERYKDKLQMPHPDYVVEPGEHMETVATKAATEVAQWPMVLAMFDPRERSCSQSCAGRG